MLKEITGLESPIFLYIRGAKNQKIGILLAGIDDEGIVNIGWSLCNKSDTFYKDDGLNIAAGRAFANDRIHANYCHEESPFCLEEIIPQTVLKSMGHFLTKIKKYYKVNAFSNTVIYLMASKSTSYKG